MFAPKPLQPLMAQQPQHLMHLERLSSPIHLDGPFSAPPATCSARRRPRPASSKRRRMAPRVEQHAFDELPWISTLESGPELLNPWDIADLSLIPDDADLQPSSGPGPVRRRKTSLRSSPRQKSSASSSPHHHHSIHSTRDTLLLSTPSVPTPRSRFIPSRVLFHNLMPVPCDFRTESPHPCITSSPSNF